MNANQIFAALGFILTTTAIPFLTKKVVSTYHYPFPFFLLILRLLVGLLAVELLRWTGFVSVKPFTVRRGLTFALPALLNAFQSYCTVVAMKGMSIPMFTAIRQCLPLVNVILMVCVFRKPIPPVLVISSVLMITVGSLIAGFSDTSFDTIAYLACLGSVIGLGIYGNLVQKITEHRFSVTEIFHLNCYMSLPIFIVGCLLTRESKGIFQYPNYSDPFFQLWILLTVIAGNFLTVSMFLCTHLNSALTTSLIGVLKNIPQTFLGFFTFGGITITALNSLGFTLNMMGGCIFAYGKYREAYKIKTS